MKSQRWVPICQACWSAAQPTEHFPVATQHWVCGSCGQEAFIVNVHPEIARAARAAIADRKGTSR